MPVTPAFKRLIPEDLKSKAHMNYIVTLSPKKMEEDLGKRRGGRGWRRGEGDREGWGGGVGEERKRKQQQLGLVAAHL